MVTTKSQHHQGDEQHEVEKYDTNGVNIEVSTPSCSRTFAIKPLVSLVFIWLVTFLVILVLILKVDQLRIYVMRDLVPVKELENLEKKAERLFSYQRKHGTTIKRDPDENITIETRLNKTLRTLLAKSNFDVSKEFQKFMQKHRCTPIQHIVFLKTHKTASSTLTNILNRYADLRELSVVLPAMGDVRFAWPRKFHWSSVDLLRLDGQPGDILVNHARYNREQMDMIMKEGTQYISVLRDPVTQFESSFYYFEFDRRFQLNTFPNPIEEFLKYPDEHLYNLTLILGDLPETMNLIQSGMFYDFGYDFLDLEDDSVIKNVLNKLESDFKLILIMEYFDESLVLLKKELCWDFDDILYIKQNQRLLKRVNLTEETKQRIRDWNRADVMLYRHFNETFWKKIEKHGEEFWNEVQEFKERNAKFEETCALHKVTTKGFHINTDVSSSLMNPKVDRFNRYLCKKILMSEVDYLKYLRKKLTFGYQSILIAEGIKSSKRTGELTKRLKLSTKKKPKFYVPRNPLDEQKKYEHKRNESHLIEEPRKPPRKIFIPYT